MPELPEVEIVRNALAGFAAGRKIRSAFLHREKLVPGHSPAEFADLVSSASIESVDRRGKHLLMELDNGNTLIVHLRMSGRFILLDQEEENPKFTHAEFVFPEGDRLIFVDQRHFGYMNVVPTNDLQEAKELAKLAPEPLSTAFSRAFLREALASTSRELKTVLLDQTKVCGLGNIYAAEAMFIARLHPGIRANRVSAVKSNRLHGAIQGVLQQSIAAGLEKEADKRDLETRYYNGSSEGGWLVYDREGEPCERCSSPIKRLKQAGRSTFYCPRCQKMDRRR